MKFICTVCGYIHEGDAAPAECPQCHVPASKFKVLEENNGIEFVAEHHIGDGVVEDQEVMEGLKAHFAGECTEVGMYLAMSRQACLRRQVAHCQTCQRAGLRRHPRYRTRNG